MKKPTARAKIEQMAAKVKKPVVKVKPEAKPELSVEHDEPEATGPEPVRTPVRVQPAPPPPRRGLALFVPPQRSSGFGGKKG